MPCGKPNCKKCQKGEHREEKHEEKCHTTCDADVDVNVDLTPKVHCTEKCHRNAKFDIELDIKAKPSCCIKKSHHERTHKCGHKCFFTVDVDVDFCCKPKVSQCSSPSAKFDLDVRVDSETHCHLNKRKC